MWKNVIDKTAIRHQPFDSSFYFCSYIWLQVTFGQNTKMSFENLLPVSTKPRYVEYFEKSNTKLSTHILNKVFQGWKSQAQRVNNFRSRRRNDLLKKIIDCWSDYSSHKMIQKSKLAQFTQQRNSRQLAHIYFHVKEHLMIKASLSKRLKWFVSTSETDLMKQYLISWRVNYKKSVIYKEQEAIADQMCRKTLLNHFYAWRCKFLRYQQLSVEDQKLKVHQDQNLLQKCWDALKQSSQNEKWEKQANLAADEERRYWLAKVAFQGWSQSIDKLRQKNNLCKLLDTHHGGCVKRKVFKYFRMFVEYKQEQRYNDMVVVHEIVQIRQKNILNNWQRVYKKRQAAKQLTFHSERAIKGTVIRSMIERYYYQNSVHTYLKSQRHFYVQMTAFNRLRQAVEKKKALDKAEHAILHRRDYWTAKIAFANWSNKSKTLKKNLTTYAFIAIQIKNVIEKDCFNSLKTFAKYQKNKRISDKYYESRLKTKLLNSLYNKSLTSELHYDLSLSILNKQVYKIKSTVLSAWHQIFEKSRSERAMVENFTKKNDDKRLKEIVGQWRHYTEHKVKISAAYSTYKTKIDQKRTQYGFKRLLSCVEGQKDRSTKNKRADHFHYQTL